MNREVRFRAWIKDIKRMKMVLRLNLGKKQISTIDNETFDYNRYELLEYTGLKDINSVDIYEGDYVLLKNGSASAHVVVRSDRFHEIVTEIKRWISERGGGSAEALGNIYENPNLLKED